VDGKMIILELDFTFHGYNSHVILKVVATIMESRLDLLSLPSHTSHALQPLNVPCFKPFETVFRQSKILGHHSTKERRWKNKIYVNGQRKN
jgi:hypothetical protein